MVKKSPQQPTFCITQSCSSEDLIKKSRFIGVVKSCESEREVLDNLKSLQAEHPHANHLAFAYRIKTENGIISRFNDAGEPSGTAGKPILQHLEGKNLINILVMVIRYFGGVKLGAGGLTRAYSNTAKKVIDTAIIQPYVEMVTLHLKLDYEQFQSFEYALKKANGQIVEQSFAEQIQLSVKLDVERMSELPKIP